MPVTVACVCGKHYAVKDELAGRRIKCPACGAVITVPSAHVKEAGDAPHTPPVSPGGQATDVTLKVRYQGQYFLADAGINVFLDGMCVGTGSARNGIDLTVPATQGRHVLEVQLAGGIRRRTYQWDFPAAGTYETTLSYSRVWGNFDRAAELWHVGLDGRRVCLSSFSVTGPADLAGFWRRVAAFLLDWLILAPPVGLVCFIAVQIIAALTGAAPARPGGPVVLSEGAQVLVGLCPVLLIWLYFAAFESSRYQATPGKMILRLRVTNLEGKRIGFDRASGRIFAKWLSVLPVYIGFVMPAFTRRKQALHDMVAGTLVVRTSPNPLSTGNIAVPQRAS